MRLRNVTFANWLRSHDKKALEERWLRELYPWPVLAQVDCDEAQVGRPQRIAYDGVEYDVTLKSIRWQPKHGTYRYRLLVESDGLGWHARSFSDEIMSNNIKKSSGIRVKNGLGMTKISNRSRGIILLKSIRSDADFRKKGANMRSREYANH